MKNFSIRARLTIWYVLVLATATMMLAGGAWWLFRASIQRAADDSLAGRVEGTRRFIVTTQHELPPEELHDEFKEFADMTHGEALIEVAEEAGRVLIVPALPGWEQLHAPLSPAADLRPVPMTLAGEPYRAVATELSIDGHRYRLWAATSMKTAYGALNRFGWLLAAVVPGVLALAAAGGFWVSGRALAPVDRITRDVQSISFRNLDRRLEVPAAEDEVRRLAVTFNDMLTRLQTAVADMVQFTADASHELRTPVSITRTTADVTLARTRTADEYRDALVDISGQMARISTLVDNLLSLARSDAGVEAPATTRVDVGEIASDTARSLKAPFDRQAISLDVSTTDQAVAVQGSAEGLRRLFVVLLDNALKYTPKGGRVSLRIDRQAAPSSSSGQVIIEIVDSGIGLEDVDQDRAFDRFYRGTAARQMAPEGTGLGLSIARTIVERHAGEITLSAASGGRGCCARVTLPSVS